MNYLARSLSFAFILAVPMVVAACSSDDEGTSTTEVVVSGAPLTITNPVLVGVTDADADVVVGIVSNVTDRTIEITSASSSAGAIEFRSADGSLLSSLNIDPNSDFALEANGVHLELIEATSDDAVDVVLGLDIQDSFDFTAVRGE